MICLMDISCEIVYESGMLVNTSEHTRVQSGVFHICTNIDFVFTG